MKKTFLLLGLLLTACATPNLLKNRNYEVVPAGGYALATWHNIQKSTQGHPLKVYIEGDGNAFNNRGIPTDNPTPKGRFIQELSAGDSNPNVVYLGRPCQWIPSTKCSVKDWTTGRFSKEILNAMDDVVIRLMKKAKTDRVILIGFSGGAQIAEVIAVRHPEKIKKLITVAGVLDYKTWAEYLHDKELIHSMNLSGYLSKLKGINQVHYVGTKDPVVPLELMYQWVDESLIVPVKGAKHTSGYEDIYPLIWNEK